MKILIGAAILSCIVAFITARVYLEIALKHLLRKTEKLDRDYLEKSLEITRSTLQTYVREVEPK